MPKVSVKANEDFFDGANQMPRKKGSEFVLQAEYAKQLGKVVTVGKALVVPTEKKAVAPEKEKQTSVKHQEKPQLTNIGIDKVKPKAKKK